MRVIGLTGGVGSGKSTVAQHLQELGTVLVDADKVGHQTYLPGSPAWKDLVAEWGQELLQPDQEIDRKKLGSIVFSDPKALARLNSIVHPRMRDIIQQQLTDLNQNGVRVAVLEAAILIEAKWIDIADEIWVVDAPEAAVIQRLQKRNSFTEEQARARIKSQLPREERLSYADVVIDTDCPLDEVRSRVRQAWEQRIKALE